jgi:addiction module RelE/StbE family toxin
MAYKLIWSPMALDDLRDLVRFIARDSPEQAATFGFEVIHRAEMVRDFPEIGGIVPERRDPSIREIIVRPYRVIYRVRHDRELIEFVRVWHAARGEPEGV